MGGSFLNEWAQVVSDAHHGTIERGGGDWAGLSHQSQCSGGLRGDPGTPSGTEHTVWEGLLGEFK